jgi:outer membrane autotransporter protein
MKAGYGLMFCEEIMENKDWFINPHIQLDYTWSDSDDVKLGKHGQVDNINGDGRQLRLGTRNFSMHNSKERYGVYRFFETN